MELKKWNDRINEVKEYMKTEDFLLNEDAEDIKSIILYQIGRKCPLNGDIKGHRMRAWNSVLLTLRETNYHNCGCGKDRTPLAIKELLDNIRPQLISFYYNTPLITTFYRKGSKENRTYHTHNTAEEYADYQQNMLRLKLMKMYREGRIDITGDSITIINEGEEE